jgi:hypothetical protein
MQAVLKLRAKVRRMGNTESVQILKAQNAHCVPSISQILSGQSVQYGAESSSCQGIHDERHDWLGLPRRGGIRQIEIPRWLGGLKGNRQDVYLLELVEEGSHSTVARPRTAAGRSDEKRATLVGTPERGGRRIRTGRK